MNDLERRLRDLGERAKDDIGREPRLRPAALRRIRRRRLMASTAAFTCAVTIVGAGAFALAGRTTGPRPIRPADVVPTPFTTPDCPPAFVPGAVPEGFSRTLERPRVTTGRGVIGIFRGPGDAAIELTLAHYATTQFRPRWIEVLGTRASLGETRAGWSVELHLDEGCGYILNGYEVTEGQLERFARGLRSEDPGVFTEPYVGTIWPPDDFGPDAAQQCTVDMHERDDPVAVAKDFLATELGWEDAIVIEPKRWWEPWYATRSAPDAFETPPGVELRMSEAVAPNCWSVESVGTFDGSLNPEGLEVSVRGSRIDFSFLPREETLQVIGDVRYGPLRPPFRHSVGSGEDGRGRLDLDFVPTQPGRLLLHFQDHDKGDFYAIGVHLPPGDYDFP